MIFDEQAEKALLGALIQHENPSGYLLALSEDDMVFEDDKIILKKYHPACIFCGDARDVAPYKGKLVCKACMADLSAGKTD